MKSFSVLCQRLESQPFNRSKAERVAQYLRTVPEREGDWALALLLGAQLPQLIEGAELERWVRTETGIPEWLFAECREAAADLPETVALLAELRHATDRVPATDLSLRIWIEERLLPLAAASPAARKAAVLGWWDELDTSALWTVKAMALGRFPVHIPRRTAEDALLLVDPSLAASAHTPATELDARLARLPQLTSQTAAAPKNPNERPPQLDLFR